MILFTTTRTVLFSCLTFFCLTSLEAATYYVSKTGNDSNLGTSTAPFLTVQKAATLTAAGDTVNIAAGTYVEKVTETTSGTSSAHITFSGAGAATVTIGGFYITGAYVDVSGVNLNGANVDTNDGCFQLMAGADHCTFSSSTVTGSAGYSAVAGACGVSTGYPSANYCTFDHITINNPDNHAVILLGTNNTFSNGTIFGTKGWDCFRIIGDNITVSGTTITDWSNPNANENHPDLFQTFTDGVQTCRNVLIQNNICLHAGDDVQFGNLEDTFVDGHVSNWTFRNNIFANVARTINVAIPNCTFQNNTFYRCGTSSSWTITIISNSHGHANYPTILNNIFYDCALVSQVNNGWYAGDNVTGPIADYNLVCGTGQGTTKTATYFKSGIGGITGTFEVHGLDGVDPMFTNPSSFDFSLKSGSPAVGMGASATSVATIAPSNARVAVITQ